MFRIGKFIETENRLVVARSWEEEKGMGSNWLMGTQVSFWGAENVLELDRGGDCTTLAELVTLK